jgi:hypothetical protein
MDGTRRQSAAETEAWLIAPCAAFGRSLRHAVRVARKPIAARA